MDKLFKRKETSVFICIIILIIFATFRNVKFIIPSNLYDILNDSSILILASFGQFLVILSGGIDLSVASGLGLTAMSVAMLNQHFPAIPIYIIILISIIIGLILGMFNGALVTIGKIPPIITTLGTMSIYRGFIFVLSKGQWVDAHEMSEIFKDLVHFKIFGLTILIIFAFLGIIIFYLFANHTKTGREIYAVGGNDTASNYAGINVKKIKFIVYSINGAIFGLCAYFWAARYASVQNESASGFELQTIAACVIGGVSIAGGSGGVIGVFMGAIFIGLLNNALTQINISPFWQMTIQGIIILGAIIINNIIDRKNQ